MLTENCCWYMDWIVLCWFISHHMCLLGKFSMPFLLKPASSVKNAWLLKKGSSRHCERNHRKNFWYQWKSSGLRAHDHCKWYGYCNCSWRTCHTVVHTTCSAACMGIILCVFHYVLFHINCSCTSVSSMVHHRRANITSFHVVKVSSMKLCIEDTSLCTTLQLLHHCQRLCSELSAYWHILRMCISSF
jgi:hypothetical protein